MSEALGISSLPAMLEGIEFPLSMDRFIELYGTRAITVPGGQIYELSQLVMGYVGDELASMGDVIGAVKEGIRSVRLARREWSSNP